MRVIPSPSTEISIKNLSVEDAAAEIVRLINAKPATPTAEEIAALLGKPASGGDLVLTISGAAQAIAELYRLRDAMEMGQWRQSKLPAADATSDEPTIPFEEHKEVADNQRDVLERLLLGLEPQNLDEVLSLLLMARHMLEGFASCYSTRNNDPRAERQFDAIDRAVQAMARYLVNRAGAKTPLLRGYFLHAELVSPPEQIATALARAQELAEQAGQSEGGDHA